MEGEILDRIDMVRIAIKRKVSAEIDNIIKEDSHNLKGLVAVCIDHCCDVIQQEVKEAFAEGGEDEDNRGNNSRNMSNDIN